MHMRARTRSTLRRRSARTHAKRSRMFQATCKPQYIGACPSTGSVKLSVTSRGARVDRTGGQLELFSATVCSSDIIRLALLLFFLFTLGPPMACFGISLSWLESRYSRGVKVLYKLLLDYLIVSNVSPVL